MSLFTSKENKNNFNIFNFYRDYKEDSFNIISKVVYQNLELINLINIDKFDNFLNTVKSNYLKSPTYHNEINGVDVSLSVFQYIHFSNGVFNKTNMDKISLLALITAALCHDIGHPGFNNNFHLNSLSEYEVNSNGKSPLEFHHAYLANKIVIESENNIFDSIQTNPDKEVYKKFRKMLIESILSTDMIFHFRINSNIRTRCTSLEIINGSNINLLIPDKGDNAFEIKQEFMNYILHTADISHNSKKFEVSYEWT